MPLMNLFTHKIIQNFKNEWLKEWMTKDLLVIIVYV